MDRRIDAHTARTQFGQLMDLATRNNERFIVERRGEPAVVIISVQDFIRAAAPPPDWLQKAWAGAKARGLVAMPLAEIEAEIAAHRPSRNGPQHSIARSHNVSQATLSRFGAVREQVELKLYSHVITHDTGLAPNPFHGFCTSAVCTPSHKKAKLRNGDWLIGNSRSKEGNRLVYAMRISEVMSMNNYFRDGRFERKKPKADGTLIEQCGDNIYFRGDDGQWKRLPSPFHNDSNAFDKDVGDNFEGNPVFVAEHFYYFGSRRVAIPDRLARVICGGRGVHNKSDLAEDFVRWLEDNYQPGVLGMPRDMPDQVGETRITRIIRNGLISDEAAQTKNQKRSDGRTNPRSVTQIRPRGGCR
jgi:prevent-host-death family protein